MAKSPRRGARDASTCTRKDGRIELAKAMLAEGADVRRVARYTGLSVEALRRWRIRGGSSTSRLEPWTSSEPTWG